MMGGWNSANIQTRSRDVFKESVPNRVVHHSTTACKLTKHDHPQRLSVGNPICRRGLRTTGVESERNRLLRRGGLADTSHGDPRDPCTPNKPCGGEERRGGEWCCARPKEGRERTRCRHHAMYVFMFGRTFYWQAGVESNSLRRPLGTEMVPTPAPSSGSNSVTAAARQPRACMLFGERGRLRAC